MTVSSALLRLTMVALVVATATGQEDTSRNPFISAAMNRQPNAFYGLDFTYPAGEPRPRYRYPLPDADPNELAFINPDEDYMPGTSDLETDFENVNPKLILEQMYPGEYSGKTKDKTLKKVLLDFLDDNEVNRESSEGIKKRVLSSFRERIETEKSKGQREKLAEMFLKKLENEAEERDAEMEYDANREYIESLKDLWSKYKNIQPSTFANQDRVFMPEAMRKRNEISEYPSLGWSGVGYRKRESPASYEIANEALYRLRDAHQRPRLSKRYEQDEYDDIMDDTEPHRPYHYTQDYLYTKRKRNAVTKRSSNSYPPPSSIHHHKRFANKDQYRKKFTKKQHASGTDPKIVKDLKNIFGTKQSLDNKNGTRAEKKLNKMAKRGEVQKDATTTSSTIAATTSHSQHGVATMKHIQQQDVTSQMNDDEHLNIKKKSLDWSNYFGYDRRKKSRQDSNSIDDDWLMERYHKAITSATKKSTVYPLKFFHNHDLELTADPENEPGNENPRIKKSDITTTNESKLGEMDVKLKNIEDLIIDEALKYTGAHEGSTDTKEIQEVKDKVISRLAAAYSLEKMRRALSEFKTSIAAQRYALKNNNENKEKSQAHVEEKKSEKSVEKCDHTRPKCDEQKKTDCRSENEIDAEENTESDSSNSVPGSEPADYGILERRCRSVAAGEQSEFFYPLCKWHQLCYLCNPDDSQEALTNCDVMFLSEAYVLCQGDLVCQWAARPAVEYLRDAYETADNTQMFDRTLCQMDPAASDADSEPINHMGNKIRRR